MAFQSFAFILLFLPLVIIVYRTLASRFSTTAANAFLLLASAVFYIQSSLTNAILLAVSILFNAAIGKRIRSVPENSAWFWLVTGVSANIIFLCYFKYAAFLFTTAAPFFGLPANWMGKVVFPLGISFFTIQQIIYLVDVYERLCEPNSIFDHSLIVSYFPYVSAGPITRIRDMVKQFHAPLNPAGGGDVAQGLLRFALGLFKKAVLADTIAIVVNAGFDQPDSLSIVEAWLTCFLYAIQLFLDFSGYCDMAIGIARMLGHVLPENFNNPLTATSLTEFWQLWHMTLTNFIANYLYTPIVRSWGKVTRQKAMAATLLSMTIAGIWHGSGITFLIFGLIHGVGLATHQAWKGAKKKMPNLAGTFLTLLLVCFAFLFFRSPDMTSAAKMLAAISGGQGFGSFSILTPALKSNWRITALICAIGTLVAFMGPSSGQFAKTCHFTKPLAFAVAGALLVSLLFLNSIPEKGFIYVGF